jgi:hypothetical protein
MRPFSPSVVYETCKSYFAIRHLLLTFYWISQKLVSTILYDRAQTPYQRLGALGVLAPEKRQELADLYQRLNPAAEPRRRGVGRSRRSSSARGHRRRQTPAGTSVRGRTTRGPCMSPLCRPPHRLGGSRTGPTRASKSGPRTRARGMRHPPSPEGRTLGLENGPTLRRAGERVKGPHRLMPHRLKTSGRKSRSPPVARAAAPARAGVHRW